MTLYKVRRTFTEKGYTRAWKTASMESMRPENKLGWVGGYWTIFIDNNGKDAENVSILQGLIGLFIGNGYLSHKPPLGILLYGLLIGEEIIYFKLEHIIEIAHEVDL